MFGDCRARCHNGRSLGIAAIGRVDDNARGQPSFSFSAGSIRKDFRWQTPVLPLQGDCRREKIGTEEGIHVTNTKTRISAGHRKLRFVCAFSFPTFGAGEFLLRISHSKTADATAARILRLVQLWFGCSRHVGEGRNVFLLTLRAPLRVLAILRFENEEE